MEMRMMNVDVGRQRGAGRRLFGIVVLPLLFFVASGCNPLDSLLEVELPGDVTEADLDNPALARTLVLGAQGDFECGFTQHVRFSGYWSREIWQTGGGLASSYWALRSPVAAAFHAAKCVGGGEGPTWTPFQVSRVAGEGAIERINEWISDGITIPNSEYLIGRAELYVGYDYLLLSETFCEVAFDAGPIQSRADGFRLAEEHFTAAIASVSPLSDAGADSIINVALVGRARARLNLGDAPGVLADANAVTGGFEWFATYDASPSRRRNIVWDIFNSGSSSVPVEYQDLEVQGVADPRVQAHATGDLATDGVNLHWIQDKYPSRSANIPMASWREAQLMIAEVEGGQTAVDIINMLRDTHSLPNFSSTDAAEIEAQVEEERRRELWLQGTRLGDMLRLNSPFRTGVDHRGRAFGIAICVPLPQPEQFGNPNIGAS